MIDDQQPMILSLAGRTISRIERDPETPVVILFYDEHDKLMFKAIALWCENGGGFNTSAIDNHDDCGDADSYWSEEYEEGEEK